MVVEDDGSPLALHDRRGNEYEVEEATADEIAHTRKHRPSDACRFNSSECLGMVYAGGAYCARTSHASKSSLERHQDRTNGACAGHAGEGGGYDCGYRTDCAGCCITCEC
jgi:hypothetical protein